MLSVEVKEVAKWKSTKGIANIVKEFSKILGQMSQTFSPNIQRVRVPMTYGIEDLRV